MIDYGKEIIQLGLNLTEFNIIVAVFNKEKWTVSD